MKPRTHTPPMGLAGAALLVVVGFFSWADPSLHAYASLPMTLLLLSPLVWK